MFLLEGRDASAGRSFLIPVLSMPWTSVLGAKHC